MFWVDQEPYFKTDVLTCFSREWDWVNSGIGLHIISSGEFVINRSFMVCRDVRNFTLNGLCLYISQPPFFFKAQWR
jgi:hypothetical protein